MRNRIMRCPHGINAKLILQDISILTLHRLRHCIADIRPALVAVKTSELNLRSVEIQTVCLERDRPETESRLIDIFHFAVLREHHFKLIKSRLLQTPDLALRDDYLRLVLTLPLENDTPGLNTRDLQTQISVALGLRYPFRREQKHL